MVATVRYFFALAAITLWLGGLTFYAAFVVPIGSSIHGSMQQGLVTQVVTNRLNVVGVVAIGLLGWQCWSVRSWWLRGTWCLLVAVQLALFAAHLPLDAMLDAEQVSVTDPDQFYQLHRVYLILTTVQWLAGTLHLWGLAKLLHATVESK